MHDRAVNGRDESRLWSLGLQVPGRGSRDWEWGRGRGGRGVGWGTFEYVLWTQGAHHTAQLLHDQEDAMSGPPSLSACYTDKNFSVHV